MTGTDPVVPAFPAGYGPLPADFNGWVQAPFQFLTTRVVFRAEYHGVTTLTGSLYNTVPYDTILEDPYSGWNASSHVWACPAGCSGLYEVSMTGLGASAGNATTAFEVALYLDGSLYYEASTDWAVNGHASGTCGTTVVSMIGGVDSVSGRIWTNTTVNTTGTAGQYPTIEIMWLGL